MTLELQPVAVATSEPVDGFLVFAEGRLVAVISQLTALHGDKAGWWFLEKGFGRLDRPDPPLFPTRAEAEAWMAGVLG